MRIDCSEIAIFQSQKYFVSVAEDMAQEYVVFLQYLMCKVIDS